eukprot:1180487-Prorocentrum_minimum.AAC.1
MGGLVCWERGARKRRNRPIVGDGFEAGSCRRPSVETVTCWSPAGAAPGRCVSQRPRVALDVGRKCAPAVCDSKCGEGAASHPNEQLPRCRAASPVDSIVMALITIVSPFEYSVDGQIVHLYIMFALGAVTDAKREGVYEAAVMSAPPHG